MIRPTTGRDQVSPRGAPAVPQASEHDAPVSVNVQRTLGYARFDAAPAVQLVPLPSRQPGEASLFPVISPNVVELVVVSMSSGCVTSSAK